MTIFPNQGERSPGLDGQGMGPRPMVGVRPTDPVIIEVPAAGATVLGQGRGSP
jgi:hypothetical protein